MAGPEAPIRTRRGQREQHTVRAPIDLDLGGAPSAFRHASAWTPAKWISGRRGCRSTVARPRSPNHVRMKVHSRCAALSFSFLPSRSRLPSPVRSRGNALDTLNELLPGQSFELQRASAPRLPRRGDAGVSVHAEQRRAGRAQRDRHLVRRPSVSRGHVGHGRSVLAGARVHTAIRRRRPVGANVGGPRVRRTAAMRAPRRRRGRRCGPRCSRCPRAPPWR